jgi:GT2 family glycosyltransferase
MSRPTHLVGLLECLARQLRPPDAVIVIDASPGAEAEEALRAFLAREPLTGTVLYERVRGEGVGLTRQRNRAARWCSTDLMAFFDDDLQLDAACLSEMEKVHRAEPGAAGVAAREEGEGVVREPLWRLRRLFRLVPSLEPGRYHRSGMSTPWSLLRDRDGVFEGDWVPGGATMWKTQLVRELGFHDGFAGYGQAEDLEFSLRAARRGRLVMTTGARYRDERAIGGRPDPYRRSYMAMQNRYWIHRTLPDRGARDVAWFVYTWSLDTVMLARHLVFPGRWGMMFREIAGRAAAVVDLLRGRSSVTESRRANGDSGPATAEAAVSSGR